MRKYSNVAKDEKAYNILTEERQRQEDVVSLIASENYVSQAVQEAQGSELTNQYAEGYPGNRYYAGCENADRIEKLAISRAKRLWGAEHVNVQPHSGTQANQAVYLAELEPGDTIMSLKLSHGGHLSHGSPVNFTGKVYNSVHYEVDTENGYLNYDKIEKQVMSKNPDILVSGFSAYPREVDFERMQTIAESVGATHVADIAHITGLIAAGKHQSPVGVTDYVTGSTHKTIRAGRGGIIMTGDENADKIDKAVFPGSQGGPAMHSIAGKAVGFGEALSDDFDEYIESVLRNVSILSEQLKSHGFNLVTNGTDNHLVLIDFSSTHPELTGKKAEERLAEAGIVVNKNTVPGDERSPFVTSGIRMGTPCITTRGVTPTEMKELSEHICTILDNPDSEKALEQASNYITELTNTNPVYP